MSGKPLRDYQQKAVNNIFAEWNRGIRRTMLVVPTGTGKTRIASEVASLQESGQKMLWLCHREELAYQAQRALREATGRIVDLEMGDFRAAHRDASIVVAMVQSIQGKRRRRYGPDRFQVGVIDECFPAGTLVDGRPIETIKPGGMVNSFNHETKQIEKRKVLRTSSRTPSALVRVVLSSGTTFVCTPEHPFFASEQNGNTQSYVPALSLTSDSFVLRGYYEIESADGTSVFSLFKDRNGVKCDTYERSDSQSQETREGVLLSRMSETQSQQREFGTNGENEQATRERKNANAKPDVCGRSSGKNEIEDDRKMSDSPGRERQGYDSASDDSVSVAVENHPGHCGGTYRCDEKKVASSIPLQDRSCISESQSLHRGRREQSLSACQEGNGQEEGSVFDWCRVHSVEVLEPTCDGEFGGLCPGGTVHNLEVEGNHNYFVNGYLVHNCHHATAKTYMATIDYFTGINRWLGLTATPKRSDGVALGKVFESVAYHMEVSTAIDLGWLVAPKQRIASCRDIDLRNVDTVAGDFHKAQLKAQLMKQQVVDQIARKSIAVADGRQTIVFCQTVDQAHALSRVFTLLGEKSVSICGKTPSGIRKDRVDRFRSGSARFLCQVNICTEGFDVPECEVVSMARPTKSQPVFAQAVGRGLRPLLPPQGLTPSERRKEIQASTKPHATVLDFYGNTGRHKLCNTGDLLGGEYEDEVRAMAVRKAQEIDQDIDMIALLEQCKDEIAKLPQAARAGSSQDTEQDKLYKLFAHALMRYEPHPCDALGIDPKLPQAAVDKDDTYGGSMSRSVKCCENHRLTATEIGKMSQYQVVYVARVLEDRESRGLCTYPQLRFLYKHGYPPNLTIPQASQKIARIKANKGRRPSEDGPNEILRRLVDRLSVPRR